MSNPLGQFVMVVDFTGSGYANFEFQTCKILIETILNHYPERLSNAFLCHVTWPAKVFWQAIQVLMDEKVRRKIHLLNLKSHADYQDYFEKHVDASQLPTFCGGEDQYVFDPEDVK